MIVEHPADQAQGDGLHGRTDEQEWSPPRLVDQGDGHSGEEQVHEPNPHRGGEGRVVQGPRRREDPRGVVEDRVDPAELRGCHQQHGDHQRTAVAPGDEFREPALLAPGGGPDRDELALGVVRPADLLEDGPRLLASSLLRQPARALGHGEQQPQEHDGRDGLEAEHPPPAVRRVPGLVAQPLDHLVDEQRQEDAADDPELEERTQPSPRPLGAISAM